MSPPQLTKQQHKDENTITALEVRCHLGKWHPLDGSDLAVISALKSAHAASNIVILRRALETSKFVFGADCKPIFDFEAGVCFIRARNSVLLFRWKCGAGGGGWKPAGPALVTLPARSELTATVPPLPPPTAFDAAGYNSSRAQQQQQQRTNSPSSSSPPSAAASAASTPQAKPGRGSHSSSNATSDRGPSEEENLHLDDIADVVSNCSSQQEQSHNNEEHNNATSPDVRTMAWFLSERVFALTKIRAGAVHSAQQLSETVTDNSPGCHLCGAGFGLFRWRHQCRSCKTQACSDCFVDGRTQCELCVQLATVPGGTTSGGGIGYGAGLEPHVHYHNKNSSGSEQTLQKHSMLMNRDDRASTVCSGLTVAATDGDETFSSDSTTNNQHSPAAASSSSPARTTKTTTLVSVASARERKLICASLRQHLGIDLSFITHLTARQRLHHHDGLKADATVLPELLHLVEPELAYLLPYFFCVVQVELVHGADDYRTLVRSIDNSIWLGDLEDIAARHPPLGVCGLRNGAEKTAAYQRLVVACAQEGSAYLYELEEQSAEKTLPFAAARMALLSDKGSGAGLKELYSQKNQQQQQQGTSSGSSRMSPREDDNNATPRVSSQAKYTAHGTTASFAFDRSTRPSAAARWLYENRQQLGDALWMDFHLRNRMVTAFYEAAKDAAAFKGGASLAADCWPMLQMVASLRGDLFEAGVPMDQVPDPQSLAEAVDFLQTKLRMIAMALENANFVKSRASKDSWQRELLRSFGATGVVDAVTCVSALFLYSMEALSVGRLLDELMAREATTSALRINNPLLTVVDNDDNSDTPLVAEQQQEQQKKKNNKKSAMVNYLIVHRGLEPMRSAIARFLHIMPAHSRVLYRYSCHRLNYCNSTAALSGSATHLASIGNSAALEETAPPFELSNFTVATHDFATAYSAFVKATTVYDAPSPSSSPSSSSATHRNNNKSTNNNAEQSLPHRRVGGGSFTIFVALNCVQVAAFTAVPTDGQVMLPSGSFYECTHRVPLHHLSSTSTQMMDISCVQQIPEITRGALLSERAQREQEREQQQQQQQEHDDAAAHLLRGGGVMQGADGSHKGGTGNNNNNSSSKSTPVVLKDKSISLLEDCRTSSRLPVERVRMALTSMRALSAVYKSILSHYSPARLCSDKHERGGGGRVGGTTTLTDALTALLSTGGDLKTLQPQQQQQRPRPATASEQKTMTMTMTSSGGSPMTRSGSGGNVASAGTGGAAGDAIFSLSASPTRATASGATPSLQQRTAAPAPSVSPHWMAVCIPSSSSSSGASPSSSSSSFSSSPLLPLLMESGSMVAGLGRTALPVYVNCFVNANSPRLGGYHSMIISLPHVGIKALFHEPRGLERYLQRRLRLGDAEFSALRSEKLLLVLEGLDDVALRPGEAWPGRTLFMGASLTRERWPLLRVFFAVGAELLREHDTSISALTGGGRARSFTLLPLSDDEIAHLGSMWLPDDSNNSNSKEARSAALYNFRFVVAQLQNHIFRTPFTLFLLTRWHSYRLRWANMLQQREQQRHPSSSTRSSTSYSSSGGGIHLLGGSCNRSGGGVVIGMVDEDDVEFGALPGSEQDEQQQQQQHDAHNLGSICEVYEMGIRTLIAENIEQYYYSARGRGRDKKSSELLHEYSRCPPVSPIQANRSNKKRKKGGGAPYSFYGLSSVDENIVEEWDRNVADEKQQQQQGNKRRQKQQHQHAFDDDDDDVEEIDPGCTTWSRKGATATVQQLDAPVDDESEEEALHDPDAMSRLVDDVFDWSCVVAVLMVADGGNQQQSWWRSSLASLPELFDNEQYQTQFPFDPQTMAELAPLRFHGSGPHAPFEFRHRSLHEFLVAYALATCTSTRMLEHLRMIAPLLRCNADGTASDSSTSMGGGGLSTSPRNNNSNNNSVIFSSSISSHPAGVGITAASCGLHTARFFYQALPAHMKNDVPMGQLVQTHREVNSDDLRLLIESAAPAGATSFCLETFIETGVVPDLEGAAEEVLRGVSRLELGCSAEIAACVLAECGAHSLQALSLNNPTLGDAGPRAALQDIVSLRRLDFSGTLIGDSTIRQVALYVHDIHALNISRCRVSSSSLALIEPSQMQRLRCLNVDASPNVDDTFISSAAKAASSNMQHLDISFTGHVTDAAVMAVADHCRDLRSFNATGAVRISTLAFARLLRQCQFLRRFTATGCLLLDDVALLHAATPNLTVLHVSRTSVSDVGLSALLRRFGSKLESLHVAGCIGGKALSEKAALAVAAAGSTRTSAQALAHRNAGTLRDASFAGEWEIRLMQREAKSRTHGSSGSGGAGGGDTSQSKYLTGTFGLALKSDSMEGGVGDADEQAHYVQLREDFFFTMDIDVGAAVAKHSHGLPVTDATLIAAAKHCPQLREIDASCTGGRVTDRGVMALAARCKHLASVSLSDTGGKVTNLGIIALAAAVGPTLRKLDVSETYGAVTDVAIAELAHRCRAAIVRGSRGSGVPVHSGGLLRELDVSYTGGRIGDASLLPLVRSCSATLQVLNVEGTRGAVSAAVVEMVAERCQRLKMLNTTATASNITSLTMQRVRDKIPTVHRLYGP